MSMDNELMIHAVRLLRDQCALLVNAHGRVEWVGTDCAQDPLSGLDVGDDLLACVHPADRSGALQLLTESRRDIVVRTRRFDGGWHRTVVDSTMVDAARSLLLLRLCDSTEIQTRELEATNALLALANESIPIGVAFDSIARLAEVAIPGADVALYMHRDAAYELVAAPTMDARWARRAFRISDCDVTAIAESAIVSARGQLQELGNEFGLGHGWLVTPAVVHDAPSPIVLVAYVGDKRFLSHEERDNVARSASLAAEAITIEERRQAGREQSRTDCLTAVETRRTFFRELAQFDNPAHVLIVKVEGLRNLNETLGYEAGDAVLQAVGNSLNGATRSRDIVGRLDGATFAIVTSARSDQDRARTDSHRSWGERIGQALTAPVIAAGTVLTPRCSMVHEVSIGSETGWETLQRAERSLESLREQNRYSGTAVNDR